MEVVVRAQTVLRPRVNISELKSAATGTVTYRGFIRGQEVKAGDLLWSLDTRSLEAQRSVIVQQQQRNRDLQKAAQAVLSYMAGSTEESETSRLEPEGQRLVELHRRELARLSFAAQQSKRDWELEKTLPPAYRTANRLQDLENAYRVALGNQESFEISQKQKYQEQLNILQGEAETLLSQWAALDQQTSASQVTSPLDGWVEEVRSFNPGDTILAGETLVRVIPLTARDLKAVLHVASNDIAELKPGLTYRLVFPKLPPSEFGMLEGELETVPQDAWLQPDAPPVFQLDGTLSRLFLENSHGLRIDLKAGMTAEARIIVKKKPIWRFLLEKLDFLS